MGLEVIGVGFGRTGTTSLKAALERLGHGPCYHMTEVFRHPQHIPLWERAAAGEAIDWEAIFGGFRATADWPACHFWRELVALYAGAKVILTVRDAASWYDSAVATIFGVVGGDVPAAAPQVYRDQARMARRIVVELDLDGRLYDRAHVIEVFNRHTESLQREIPASRLLVYRVENGWEPLCRVLGAPVPDEPFPRANTTSDFKARRAAPDRA
jgi:hypothetical protein